MLHPLNPPPLTRFTATPPPPLPHPIHPAPAASPQDAAGRGGAPLLAAGGGLAMHVAGMRPLYLNRAAVPAAALERERELLRQQLAADADFAGKPAKVRGTPAREAARGVDLTACRTSACLWAREAVGRGLRFHLSSGSSPRSAPCPLPFTNPPLR